MMSGNKKVKTFLLDKLLGKSLLVLLLRIFGLLLFFGLTLFITNNFDPKLVGRYDFTRSSLLIIGGICLLGTNQAIIYYSGVLIVRNDIFNLKNIYHKMLLVILLVSVLFLVCIEVISPKVINQFFEKDDAYILLQQVILCVFPFALMLLNFDTIRALKRTNSSEVFRNILRYTPFLIGTIYISFMNDHSWLVMTFLLGFILVAILSTVYVYFLFSKLGHRTIVEKYSFKKILKVSTPMALSAISFFLMQSVDIILLSKYESYDVVAYYGVAVKISIASSLVLASVTILLGPKISELYEKGARIALRKMLATGTKIIVLLSFPGIVILLLFPGFFLNIFGASYDIASTALTILLLAQLLVSFCGPAPIYLNMTGRQQVLNKIIFFGLLLNIVLNVVLIPRYGMNGAALATAISMLVWNVIAVLYVYKKDNIVMPNFTKR